MILENRSEKYGLMNEFSDLLINYDGFAYQINPHETRYKNHLKSVKSPSLIIKYEISLGANPNFKQLE